MDRPRGILRPAAVGRVFSLERPAPPPDLADVVDHHWIVSWDLRGSAPYRSEVLPHPAVHLTFEPDGAWLYGVQRHRHVRVLAGAGLVVGTKFVPGGFARLTARPLHRFTDTVQPVAEAFPDGGSALARAAAGEPDAAGKLTRVHAFLRERLGPSDPQIELVQAVVASMRSAAPGVRVEEVAAAHHVSTRTLQRLFQRYVGVSPKWVLQRYRLHEALERVDRGGGVDWTRLALELGYFDHAHFLRDFRALAGRSLTAYEREARAAASGTV
jgi:AraC-like DNA-binding protein